MRGGFVWTLAVLGQILVYGNLRWTKGALRKPGPNHPSKILRSSRSVNAAGREWRQWRDEFQALTL